MWADEKPLKQLIYTFYFLIDQELMVWANQNFVIY